MLCQEQLALNKKSKKHWVQSPGVVAFQSGGGRISYFPIRGKIASQENWLATPLVDMPVFCAQERFVIDFFYNEASFNHASSLS